MKYLVIGLGNFGSTLACKLTDMGHDVIGVDCNEHRVEEIKEHISVAYIMDATEKSSLRGLPLDEIDRVVVSTPPPQRSHPGVNFRRPCKWHGAQERYAPLPEDLWQVQGHRL